MGQRKAQIGYRYWKIPRLLKAPCPQQKKLDSNEAEMIVTSVFSERTVRHELLEARFKTNIMARNYY